MGSKFKVQSRAVRQ